MTNRKRVIIGLQQHLMSTITDEYETQCEDCPYYDPDGTIHSCKSELLGDAMELLKAQEQEIEDLKQEIEGHKDNLQETLDVMMSYADELKTQEPVEAEDEHREMGMLVAGCGNCHNAIRRPWAYCPFCGQAVKWE